MLGRSAAMLALVVGSLTGLGWTGDGWGQAKVARVGILYGDIDERYTRLLEPFRRRLAEEGWIEGKNISLEYGRSVNDPSPLDEAARKLVRSKVDVIVATDAPAVRTAFAVTRTIPIVASDGTTDPVAEGYVQSYTRPGGNLTGVFLDAPEFTGKWLQILKAIVPGLPRAVVLWDPAPGRTHLQAVQGTAQSLSVQLQVVEVHKPEDIEKFFSAFRGRPQALIILPSPLMYGQSERLAELAMTRRLPGASMFRPFAEAGGLIAYAPDWPSAWQRCAVLVAKILSGTKPGDLPVERPTTYQLIVNLKTAKAFGLTVPESVLYRADEVIR